MNIEELHIEEFEVDVREIDHNCELKIRQRDELLSINIPRALTAVEARSFVNTITSVIAAAEGVTSLNLDFSVTDFIDSSGLGALVNVINSARLAGWEVFASGLNEAVESVLKMTRLDRLVQLKHH